MLGYCNWCDIQTLLLGLFKPCSELSWYHTFWLISFQSWSIRNLITVYPRSERLNSLLVCQWIGFTSTSYYVGKVDKTSHQLQLACYINRQKLKKKNINMFIWGRTKYFAINNMKHTSKPSLEQSWPHA